MRERRRDSCKRKWTSSRTQRDANFGRRGWREKGKQRLTSCKLPITTLLHYPSKNRSTSPNTSEGTSSTRRKHRKNSRSSEQPGASQRTSLRTQAPWHNKTMRTPKRPRRGAKLRRTGTTSMKHRRTPPTEDRRNRRSRNPLKILPREHKSTKSLTARNKKKNQNGNWTVTILHNQQLTLKFNGKIIKSVGTIRSPNNLINRKVNKITVRN